MTFLQLVPFPVSCCSPFMSWMIPTHLPTLDETIDGYLSFNGPPFLTAAMTHTFTFICTSAFPADLYAEMHISWAHMPVCADINIGSNTPADAGRHAGVPRRLVRCAGLQDWIISQLWVGQPRICPNPQHSVHIASRVRTHSLQSRPQPSRGLYKVWFVCLLQSFFTFFPPCLVSTQPHIFLCRVHTSQRASWKAHRITSVPTHAKQRWVAVVHLHELGSHGCGPALVWG